ncbi:MAG: cytochrome b/b6 domain-containing protein [Bacteroidales bacterium]|nr:cytochrome b/b6 domain-containing protein [Bacteroidales bacterium]
MYLYPKWIRIWHVLNAVMFLILIITGLSMQYTGKDTTTYMVGFAIAVKWHNFAALVLTANYIIFVTGNLLTKNGRFYKIEKENFWSDLLSQMKYYGWGMFRGEKHPFPVTEKRKFNPLQKVTYVLAMYLALPLLIISGIGLLFPEITITTFWSQRANSYRYSSYHDGFLPLNIHDNSYLYMYIGSKAYFTILGNDFRLSQVR